METRTFTEEQISSIMYDNGIYDEETGNETIYEIVSQETVSFDQEKNHLSVEYVIHEIATGKYFKATLGQSPWYLQSEYNAKEIWEEVTPKKITTVTYN